MAQVQGRGLVAPGVPTLSNSARFQTYSLHSRSVEIQEAAAEDVHRFVGLSQGRLRERPPETAEAAIACRIHPGLGSEPHLGTSDPRFVHPPRTDPALRGRRLPLIAQWIGSHQDARLVIRKVVGGLSCPSLALSGQVFLGTQTGFRGSLASTESAQRKLGNRVGVEVMAAG